jgi:hypothetical protein
MLMAVEYYILHRPTADEVTLLGLAYCVLYMAYVHLYRVGPGPGRLEMSNEHKENGYPK